MCRGSQVVQRSGDVSGELAVAFGAWSTLLACAALGGLLSMIQTSKCVMNRRRWEKRFLAPGVY